MAGHADNRLYLVVHKALRRMVARLLNAAVRLEPPVLVEVIGPRWAVFERLLHHHHEGEDQSFFPAIAAARPDAKPLIERLEREHGRLVTELEAVDRAIEELERSPDAERQRALHDAVQRVQSELSPHLDVEEAELLPTAAESVDGDEWERLGEHALRTVPRADLPIAAGALDEVLRDLPRSEWPPPPPLPVRILLALSWRRRFRDFVAPLDA